jgi:hypothetical protein
LLQWPLTLKLSLPVTLGSLLGALLALVIPGRDLALIITGAILIALALIFTKLKQIIESAATHDAHFGATEFVVFCLIGGWLGFIVLDGATYLLLGLTLVLGLPLTRRMRSRARSSCPPRSLPWVCSHTKDTWT